QVVRGPLALSQSNAFVVRGLLLAFERSGLLLQCLLDLGVAHSKNCDRDDQQCEQKARKNRGPLIPPGELAKAIDRRGLTRLHRLVMQVALYVGGKTAGRLVAAVAVLL